MRKHILLQIIILAMIFFSISLFSQEQETFTLEDTIKAVLMKNLSITEASDAQAIIQAKIEQTRSQLYPTVDGEASYNRVGPAPTLSIPNLGSFELFPHDNYELSISGRYLIYDFNRTKETIRLAQTQIYTVKDHLETLKRDLAYQTAQVFYTILFLQENIKVQAEHIRILNEHLSTSQKKLESGTATELDVLTTRVRLTAAESQEVELQSALEKQLIILHKLMGLPNDTPLKLSGSFLLKDPQLSVSPLLTSALNDRIEIKTVDHSLETARVQDSLAHLSLKPTLHLNLLVGMKDGYVPDLTKPFLNFVAGVKIEAPLFDGYRNKYQRAEVYANIKMLEDRKRDLQEFIKAEVLQAVNELQSNKKTLEMSRMNIKLAEKAVDFAKAKYEAGTVTNLDLLIAEEAKTDADNLQLRALYKCVLSEYTLMRAIGTNIVY